MLREEKIEKNIQEILTALRTLLGQKAFNSITIEDIMQKARLSRPTVYKYFASKEAILARLGAEMLYVLANNLVDFREWPGNAYDKLAYLYRVLGKELRTYKTVWRAMALSGAYYYEDMLNSRKYLDRFIIGILAEGQDNLEISNKLSPNEMAINLSALQTTICTEWCLGYPRRLSLSKRLILGLDNFFLGISN